MQPGKPKRRLSYLPEGMSRRDFLKHIGGGLVIAVAISDFSTLEAAVTQQMPTDPNAYLKIGLDGRATLYTGKIEMGQGVVTSLAQMMAEELDVDLYKIDMVMGDTDLCPWDQGTHGSMTTRFFGPALRAAAAEARSILVQMASGKLNVPASQLDVNDGVVFDTKNKNNKVTYASLTEGKKILKQLKEEPKLKDPSQFKVIGKSVKRMDGRAKVTGEAKYSGDIRIPGMVYAAIHRPPAHDAKLKSMDTSALDVIKDIQVIKDKDLIAVLHEDPEYAQECIQKIKADYDIPSTNLNEDTIFEHLLSVAKNGQMLGQGGDLDQGAKASSFLIDQEWHDSYYAHAPMETHTACAHWDGGKMNVWASTQGPFQIKDQIADALGMSKDNVHIQQVFIGGGFGGKSRGLQAIEAARLAKLSGKPVMVAWTRPEEFFYDTYRPAAVVKIKSGCDKNGMLTVWDYGEYFAGSRGAEAFYEIPNHRTQAFGSGWREEEGIHPFATGAWRAPGNNTNTFARESQINMLAAKAGIDPLEFRLKNLKDEKMIGVLKAAADKFGWTPIKSPSGKGYGIACGIDAGSYVAHMAEVKVDKTTGQVHVIRVVCAQDMGLVINPEGATIQMEGCITQGLGYTLSEELKFSGGDIKTKNFGTYHLPTFSMVPDIETILIKSKDPKPQGGGEPAIVCIGALVANGIYDATGARLTRMPMTPARVLEAIKKV